MSKTIKKKENKQEKESSSSSKLKQRNIKKEDNDDNNNKKITTTTTTTTTKAPIKTTDKIKLNYPVFCCSSSTNVKSPYIVTGGGGGNSKTGVPNAITLLKWNLEGSSSSEFQLIDQMDTEDCIPYVTFNDSKNQIAYPVGTICHIVDYKNDKLEKVLQFDINKNIPSNAYHLAIKATSSSPSLNDVKSNEANTNNENESTTTTTPSSASASSTPSLCSTTLTSLSTEIKLIKFNKDGDRIIIVDDKNLIKVWSLPSLNFIKIISPQHSGEITDIDIHPASSHILTTSRDCSAKIINLLNGKIEFTLLHKQKPKLVFRGCKFTSDGLYCYTAQSIPKGKNSIGCTVLSKWNFTTGKEESFKEVDIYHNTCFALSSDNKTIVIVTADAKITAYNSETFKPLDKWEPHDFVVTGACFSPDNSTIFSSSADYNCKSHRIGFGSKSNSTKLIKALFILAIIVLILSLIFAQINK
ncbi:WD-40 repeat-containing protein [Dictyostelium discoideum AX4]|uniref:WD-40 repeat-containing protein n=1 Tax=Dictyostelium discoideum TaxID=44689 RepID=Q54M76_DICDI|nr:WD-40 repeat-containing protein [Dictyostelium discoideum AX4]EAL64376.1 WD-40 repeat-containing protein [Dictyostelium discoideum AX4]|eukprot:XP_637872.1 WD-40 repeat-containing protein [Dictyostelium discoideum AX4]